MIGFVTIQVLRLQWMGIFLIFGIIPMFDKIWRHDWLNPTVDDIGLLEADWRFKLCLYLTILLDWAAFLTAMRNVHRLNEWTILPAIFLASNMCSTGFLVAHELFHKNNPVDKAVGTLHQIKNLYMHFTIEHLYGHHKRVSTPDDPASAPKGMSIYQFFPRTIIGGFRSAWQINPRQTGLTMVGSIFFVLFVYRAFGFKAMLFQLTVALGSICYLEITNYIEHYGLQRKRLPDGTYEKVTIRHSWNAPHRMSNYLVFKLQRHSDHHENSLKSYQTLCTYEDSPQLPHGYMVCTHLALFPKAWFAIMDPLVDEYNLNRGKGT